MDSHAGVWSEERFERLVARARKLLNSGHAIDDVIVLAHRDSLPFIQCVRLLTRLEVKLRDAKALVHNSAPYAATRRDREGFWEELETAALEFADDDRSTTRTTAVQQRSTATDPTKRDGSEPQEGL